MSIGRTINFGAIEEFTPSDEIELKLLAFAKKFNSKYGYKESKIILSTYDTYVVYHPKMTENLKKYQEKFAKDEKKLKDSGKNAIEVIKKMVEKKYLCYCNRKKLESWVYVSKNDKKAMTIIEFMIGVSKIIPDKKFYLNDSENHLFCPMLIKDGLVKPHHFEIIKRLKDWRSIPGAYNWYNKLIKQNLEYGDVKNVYRTNIKKTRRKE
jgi:hypothetical protein